MNFRKQLRFGGVIGGVLRGQRGASADLKGFVVRPTGFEPVTFCSGAIGTPLILPAVPWNFNNLGHLLSLGRHPQILQSKRFRYGSDTVLHRINTPSILLRKAIAPPALLYTRQYEGAPWSGFTGEGLHHGGDDASRFTV
jgi:hypothetical protein